MNCITGRIARTLNSTIQRTREELTCQERVSGIDRLSESILHDLRNPLAAIYGASEMLVNGDLPPVHIKRLAGNIHRASLRIQALLQDLLHHSRGESRAPESSCLREIATAACESLS